MGPTIPPELRRGPKWLCEAINRIRAYAISAHIDGPPELNITTTDTGTILKGLSGFETITGAVNGVPATLNVKTDGQGWTALV